jgi:HSP20 family protein
MYPVIFKKSCFPRQRDVFFNNDRFRSLFSDGADYSVPAVNIKESESHFEIEVAAPGQRKEDFRIALEKNMLTISTEKNHKMKTMKDAIRAVSSVIQHSAGRSSFPMMLIRRR